MCGARPQGMSALRVGVVGPGAVGTFAGAVLGSASADITMVGRREVSEGHGPLVALDGARTWEAARARWTLDIADIARVDVVLVAVKAGDTDEVATALAAVLPSSTPVVSLQNGLSSATRLAHRLGKRVARGVVGFNVRLEGPGRARKTTRGSVLVGELAPPYTEPVRELARCFERARVALSVVPDIEERALGKLLVNLNNGVCAATGLSIAESISDDDARRVYARCIEEGLEIMRRRGLRPRAVGSVSPAVLARVLRLPGSLVRPLLRVFGRVDPEARSSTLDDLERGRATEIDDLSGAIVAMAARSGARAPVNETIAGIVRRHEARAREGRDPLWISARELSARVEPARGWAPLTEPTTRKR